MLINKAGTPVAAGFRQIVGNRVLHPSVTIAQNTDEERPAFADLLKTQLKCLVVLGLLASHSPSLVNVDQVNAIILQPRPQRGEYDLEKISRSSCMSRNVDEIKT